jgi:3-hydroxyisobutyrate dehydrogenase-like beta-hydroxyacid dehydrogenase
MTNPITNLLNEVVYVTLAEARDTSDVFTTTVPDDNHLSKIITQTQWIID